ncbi:MAG: hypothetical protein LBU67_03175, partial [Oscillospiraceae bacterium]|nr:hypothetical protein [Oscillospiraceae bacterium]
GEALPRAQVEAQAGYALLMAHQATDWLGEYVQSIAFDDGIDDNELAVRWAGAEHIDEGE